MKASYLGLRFLVCDALDKRKNEFSPTNALPIIKSFLGITGIKKPRIIRGFHRSSKNYLLLREKRKPIKPKDNNKMPAGSGMLAEAMVAAESELVEPVR